MSFEEENYLQSLRLQTYGSLAFFLIKKARIKMFHQYCGLFIYLDNCLLVYVS